MFLTHIKIIDYCGLDRELCKWEVEDDGTTWQTVSQEQAKNLRKQFTSVLTAEGESFQGKSTDRNKENRAHVNGIIHFIGKRKATTNVTHEKNLLKIYTCIT